MQMSIGFLFFATLTIWPFFGRGSDATWISFINEVSNHRHDDTNRVYYAGTSNNISLLYHESPLGIKEWRIEDIGLLKGVQRPLECDKSKWLLIKGDKDNQFSYWDMARATLDFVRRLPSESAMVTPVEEFFVCDSVGRHKDGTPFLFRNCEYRVIATKSQNVGKDDVVCLRWLVDDYQTTTNILSDTKVRQRHSIADGRRLFVAWDDECLTKEASRRYFYIVDSFAVPFELVWDSDMCHETLVPFDEKKVIDAYEGIMLPCGTKE